MLRYFIDAPMLKNIFLSLWNFYHVFNYNVTNMNPLIYVLFKSNRFPDYNFMTYKKTKLDVQLFYKVNRFLF